MIFYTLIWSIILGVPGMFIFYLKYALIKIKLKSINIKLRAYIIKGLLLHCKIDMVTKVTSHLNRFIYVFVVYIVVAAAVAQLLLLLLLRLWRRKNLCKIFLVFLAANKLKASQGGPQLSLYVTIILWAFYALSTSSLTASVCLKKELAK